MGGGVFDITDFVENLRSTWTTATVNAVMAATLTVPWLSWLGWWPMSVFYRALLQKLFDISSKSLAMQAFFWNTAVRKGSQADDFLDATNELKNLPKTATDEEYERAERQKMAAFNALVSLRA